MSSQGSHEIPFSISSAQQPFRLLELPPELFTLLSSPSPPILHFKSPEPNLGSSEAVLCTPDRSYQLRQVQTSNTVFIIRPCTIEPGEPGAIPQPGLSAISQVTSTLELSPSTGVSATPLLKQILPIFTNAEDLATPPTSPATTKRQILNDIPLSDTACENAWIELVAFETRNPVSCFRPTANVLLKAWTSIFMLATEKAIDLTSRLMATDLQDLTEPSDESPRELPEAVLRRLLPADQQAATRDIGLSDADPMVTLTPDRDAVVKWVGAIMLEAKHSARTNAFLDEWRDLLPEGWRGYARVKLLEGIGKLSSDGISIDFVAKDEISSGTAAPAPAAAATAKRKWHDKFMQARKK